MITFKVKSFQIYPFEKKSSRNVSKFRWLKQKFHYKSYQQNKSPHMELWVKIDILSTPSSSKSEVTLTNMHYAFLLPFYFYFQCHFDTRFSKKKNLGPGRRAYQRKLSMSSYLLTLSKFFIMSMEFVKNIEDMIALTTKMDLIFS